MTSLLAVVVLTTMAGLVASLWACADVLSLPTAIFRAARVKRVRWLGALAGAILVIVVSGSVLAFGNAPKAVPAICWLGFVVGGIVGLVLGAWYLGVVRPWVAAQLRFAER
jgi:hypothetical protein